MQPELSGHQARISNRDRGDLLLSPAARRLCLRLLPPVCLVLGLVFLGEGCSRRKADKVTRRDDPIPVTTAPVRLEPLDRTALTVGTLYAVDEATLAAEVEGRVERTLAEFGNRVKAGQLLAQIDTTTYEALANQAEANLARSEANAANAQQNLRRVQQLQKDSIASQSDLDGAVAEAEQTRAAVKASDATLAVARLNVERSRVKAPFDAAIAERVASAGDFLRVGSPIFRIVNDCQLKYVFQVLESQAGQVRTGQKVRFTVDAHPGQPYEGEVYLISPQVNLLSRAFNVGARVPNPNCQLKANTFARGELVLEAAVPTAMVPIDAVIAAAGVVKVFVVAGNVARSRQVEAGRIRGGWQEILRGLKPGETVVLSGHAKLYDGAPVRIKEAAPGQGTNAPAARLPS